MPGDILNIKLSIDKHYIALQRSLTLIDVIDISTTQYYI